MKRLMHGAEPFYLPGGRTGCLLVHGFTASPQEMRGLGEHLAREGFAALGIRLFAHGTDPHDMLRARWEDWYSSLEDGYHSLRGSCDRVVAMGLSLGAALCLILAASHPLAGLVAMSTPYAIPRDSRYLAVRLFSWLVRFQPKGPPDYRDPAAAQSRVHYTVRPLSGLLEVDRALARMRAGLQAVRQPVLLIHSREDDFVPPGNMHAVYRQLGSADKQELVVENSNHLVTLDAAREQVYAAAARFAHRMEAASS